MPNSVSRQFRGEDPSDVPADSFVTPTLRLQRISAEEYTVFRAEFVGGLAAGPLGFFADQPVAFFVRSRFKAFRLLPTQWQAPLRNGRAAQ